MLNWMHLVWFHFITHWHLSDFSVLLQGLFMMTTTTTDRFSAHCSAVLLGRVFNDKFNHVILILVGFCVISPWPFSGFLSNHKRHSYDGYSMYMPCFNQFLQAVYPVGMTDLQPFLCKK